MQIKYAYHLRYRLCHLSYSSCWWVMHAFLYINRSIQLLLECASDLFSFPFRALWRLLIFAALCFFKWFLCLFLLPGGGWYWCTKFIAFIIIYMHLFQCSNNHLTRHLLKWKRKPNIIITCYKLETLECYLGLYSSNGFIRSLLSFFFYPFIHFHSF